MYCPGVGVGVGVWVCGCVGRWAVEEGRELENDMSMANKECGVEQKIQCV